MSFPLSVRLLALTVTLGVVPQLALGQATLSLEGLVRDFTGATVPNARIEVRGAAGLARSVTSDAEGQYRIDGLPPGRYTVNAEFAGFAPESITVDLAGAVTSADLTFRTLTATESLTVTAALGRRELDAPTPAGQPPRPHAARDAGHDRRDHVRRSAGARPAHGDRSAEQRARR